MATYKIVSLENKELNQVLLTWEENIPFAQAVERGWELRQRYSHLSFKIKYDRDTPRKWFSPEEYEYN